MAKLPAHVPPGFNLVHSFSPRIRSFVDIAFSPDGHLLAVPTTGAIEIRSTRTGEIHERFGHFPVQLPVNQVAWSPVGSSIAVTHSGQNPFSIWNAVNGQLEFLAPREGGAHGVSWSPDGQEVAVGYSSRNEMRIWNSQTGSFKRITAWFPDDLSNLAWSPDGKHLATLTNGGGFGAWSVDTATPGMMLYDVTCAAWLPRGSGAQIIAIARGSTFSISGIESWEPNHVLEGHTGPICGLCFSSDGRLLASKSRDGTVRLWRCDTWQPVAVLQESTRRKGGVQFSPTEPILVTHSGDDVSYHVWELDYSVLLGNAPAPALYYRNAKVVLMGDTGVGKSGLGTVLTGKPFAATESTHGRHIWVLDARDVALGADRTEARELLLWDLAGQPGYRLIHQLHLNEVAVALVVLDSRSETDPFAGVRHWDRALRQALRLEGEKGIPRKRFLVAARVDRGGVSVSRERLQATVRDLGFDGYFETSAKEGMQIEELRSAILAAIPWDSLPQVTSNELFRDIKLFLITEKKAGRLLSMADDLYRAFTLARSGQPEPEELRASFETCVGRLETQGLIRRLSFGNQVLLQPEILDAYASALINAAKSEPEGLGSLMEEDALAGRFSIPSDERLADKEKERLLLIAMVEEMFKHELALKEPTEAGSLLVFPSQFTRERPDAPALSGESVIFTFEGAPQNIYATLSVRLSHSRIFRKRDMWKNAATFTATVGGTCGIHLRELQEGQGELTLFFDTHASEPTRYQFEDYVAAHLEKRALPDCILRRRIFACPQCREAVTDSQAQQRLKRGFDSITCNVCDTRFSLLDREKRLSASVPATVVEMDRAADAQRDIETAAMTLKGKIASNEHDVFFSYNRQDREAVLLIVGELEKRGIRPWLDERELRPGLPWQAALEQHIEKIKAAAVLVGSNGVGPWQMQEQAAFLRQFVNRNCPVIPSILPECETPPKLPVFLEGMTWVDFRVSDPDPIQRMIWGITGERDV